MKRDPDFTIAVAIAMQEGVEGPIGDFETRPHKSYLRLADIAIDAIDRWHSEHPRHNQNGATK
jgi:hypothetical protein